MAKSKEVATKGTSAVAEVSEQRGFEAPGFTQEDLIMPRAKLLQALSPEIQDGVEGLSQGDLINSITQEKLSPEFIPVFAFKNYVRFNPRKSTDPNFDPEYEAGQIIWSTNDPADPRVAEQCVFGPDGEPPIAVTFFNFFCKFTNVPMPIVVSFSKTSYKAGKQLFSMAKMLGGDMFSRKYKLTTLKEKNDIGTYYVLKVGVLGHVTEEEYAACSELWNNFSFKSGDIKVHMDEEQTT